MDVKDVIDEAKSKLFSENMVKELCSSEIDEYARGVVQGRIEMLQYIENRLDQQSEDDEDNTI